MINVKLNTLNNTLLYDLSRYILQSSCFVMILHFIGSLSLQCQMHIESFMVNESTQKVLILTWLGPFFFFRTMTGSYCAILVMTICVVFWSAKSLLIYDTDHIGLIVARWFSWMRILWKYSEFWCFPSIYSLELHGYEKKYTSPNKGR